MKKNTNYILTNFSRVFFMILGSILAAIGLEIFLIPNNIIDGGITGISIMVSHLTSIQLGVFIFIFNLPFVIIGYRQIGKTFALSTIFSVICFSIGVTLLHPVPGITQDTLLATFGCIILGVGVGVGLIIRNGGSLDGKGAYSGSETEVIYVVISRLEISKLKNIVNGFDEDALITITSVEGTGKKYAKKAIH